MSRAWRVLLAIAVVRALALLHRGQAIGWDELEFFRATKWVGEGLVPFRDFWEHHTPLQWFLFAPVARLLANGPGTSAIVAMRWAQVALWVAIFMCVMRLASAGRGRWIALVLLLASSSFAGHAIEYRLDVAGNLLFIAAVLLIASRAPARHFFAAGLLLGFAVLANMRLAPVVAVATILTFRQAWRTIAGGAVAGGLFAAYLTITNAWPQFVDGVLRYNSTSARLQHLHTLADAFLAPVWTLDVAGVAFWLFGIAGCVIALRAREVIVPVLFIASILTVAAMDVQYDYHFQLTYLLMLPLAAIAVERIAQKWEPLVAIVAGTAVIVGLLQLAPRFGAAMEYQDAVMRSADRLTAPNDVVFDGAGYALRRTPAYRYWFLPTGLRFMAAKGLVPRYDIERHPPAAIIADYRAALYLRQFPPLAQTATRSFVPLYRNLWIPGISAVIGPRPVRIVWRAPKAAAYDVWASETLMRHPWFTRPFDYASLPGDYTIPLARLPRADATLAWRVDGVVQPRSTRTIVVRAGSYVELTAVAPRPAGLFLAPRGVAALAISPLGDEVF